MVSNRAYHPKVESRVSGLCSIPSALAAESLARSRPHLVAAGLLETRPGIGTVVAELPDATRTERTQLLGHEIEQLVVEAKKMGINLEDVVESVAHTGKGWVGMLVWQGQTGEDEARDE